MHISNTVPNFCHNCIPGFLFLIPKAQIYVGALDGILLHVVNKARKPHGG